MPGVMHHVYFVHCTVSVTFSADVARVIVLTYLGSE